MPTIRKGGHTDSDKKIVTTLFGNLPNIEQGQPLIRDDARYMGCHTHVRD